MQATVLDYRKLARRRLSRLAFDYLDGGAEDGSTLKRNMTAASRVFFSPQVLKNVIDCDPSTTLFNRTQSLPVLVGPTGLNGLFWPGADEILASQAHSAGVPFVLSTASTSTIEAVREASAGDLWLQLYVQQDRRIAENMMARAQAAGYTGLMLTVDTPVHGKRDHDHRNRFKLPLRVTPRMALDFMLHPHWSWQMARSGGPQLVNLAQSTGMKANINVQAAALSRKMDMALSWDDIAWLRRHWKGPVLIKGILSVEDAKRAQHHGLDGIVLSNHGGRQLPSVPSALELLPAVVDAVGASMDVLVDGGFRRGSDVVKAVAMGARGVLLGRAPLYGLAACGGQGVADVLAIFRDEIEITLRLIGCARLSQLDASVVDYSRLQNW